jgi:hypothetical protein
VRETRVLAFALLSTSSLALLEGCTTAGAASSGGIAAPAALEPVVAGALTVTSGAVLPAAGGGLSIRAASVRAVAEGRGRADAELAFTYRGPGADAAPLASGELRRQIGLKLRAQDTCNVLYVMWHIEPTTGIHVALKSNPALRTHGECGDGGYVTLAPTWTRGGTPAIHAGELRTLRATIAGDTLRVLADGAAVWTGRLPPAALAIDGPVGLRSDNGDFDVVLRAPPARAAEARR